MRTRTDRRRLGLAVVVALGCTVLASGCAPPAAADPPVLRVGAIPDQAPERVLAQHGALVERVCERVQLGCRWTAVATYEDLVAALGRGEIDLAYLGGVTFAQASHRHGVLPLAMRDIDFRFTSLVVVRRDDPARGVADLRGRRFAFGARGSTSGHYMLRERLRSLGVVPERDFADVAYAGSHDATLQAVAAGRADAGGVNAAVYYARLTAGDPAAASLRVLWQTQPYTDYVWAARPQLSAALRARLTDAFLDLAPGDARDRAALAAESANGFVPAADEDFDEVRRVVRAQGAL